MCVSNAMPWPKAMKKPEYGWKVFTVRGDVLEALHGYETYKYGKWYTAKEGDLSLRVALTYKFGFHVFFTKKDAQHYSTDFFGRWPHNKGIHKVRVHDPQHLGVTDEGGVNLPTFTCKEMMIPKEKGRTAV